MNKLVVMIIFLAFSLPALGMGSAPKKEEYKLEILKLEIISSPEASKLATTEVRSKVKTPKILSPSRKRK